MTFEQVLMSVGVLGVLLWAVVFVSMIVLRHERESRNTAARMLDCIMALTDKQAAVISTSVGKARQQPTASREEIIQQRKERKDEQNREDRIRDIESSGVMTADDIEYLEGPNGRE